MSPALGLADPNEFPLSEIRALAEAGFLSAPLPTFLGGDGLGTGPGSRGKLLPVLKDVGRGSLSVGRIYEGHANAILLVNRYGSEQQMAQVAADVLTRGLCLGVWNTGPSEPAQLIPLADGAFRLIGSKTFATGAGYIHQAIVTAALPDGGWQMCLAPASGSALRVHRETWSPLGMEATASYKVDFVSITIRQGLLIGRPGDYYLEPVFTGGALRFCAVQLGGAQALFEEACQFVNARGMEVDLFQLQRLGQIAVLVESGAQWLDRATGWLDDESIRPESLVAQTQMMRIAVEEICSRVVQLVELVAGARGMSVSEPFSRTLRDLQMYLRQAGYDRAFQIVGRHALEAYGSRE